MIVDTTTLNTLPDRELRSGVAEIIKYGLIKDAPFFGWLESNMHGMRAHVTVHALLLMHGLAGILSRDPAALAYAIQTSCENKALVVAADEREAGVRATLNLGTHCPPTQSSY